MRRGKMPNNKRGFGGVRFLSFQGSDGEWYETIQLYDVPTSSTDLPVGGVWRDGNVLKIVDREGTELLTNPGFEDATIFPWGKHSVTATLWTQEDDVVEGLKSVSCIFTLSTDVITQDVVLVVGKRYVVSGWIRATVGIASLFVTDDTSQAIKGFGTVDSDEWEEVQFEFIASHTGHVVRLGCLSDGTQAYFDDISIQEILV
jgi:hypothetical protein